MGGLIHGWQPVMGRSIGAVCGIGGNPQAGLELRRLTAGGMACHAGFVCEARRRVNRDLSLRPSRVGFGFFGSDPLLNRNGNRNLPQVSRASIKKTQNLQVNLKGDAEENNDM
jgi:hypothetical protein